MTWLNILLYLVIFSLTLSYVVIPSAVQFASSFRLRATKLSPLSARGLEWRDKGSANAAEPTLRVERIYWSVGGCTKHGRLTLNVDGVTFRVRKKPDAEKHQHKRKRRLPPPVKRLVDYFLHLFVHHWSSVTCLVSLNVSDVTVIFEDLQGLEVTVRDARIGFGKDTSSPEDKDTSQGRRPSAVLNSAKYTASSIWSHAIGRAVDRVAISVAVSNVNVLLPQDSASGAVTPTLPHLSPRSSVTSLKTDRLSRGPAMPSLGPLNSLLNMRPGDSTLHKPGSFHKLAAVENESSLHLSVGIGPNRTAFTEDNMRVKVNVGTIHASVDGIEKIMEIVKSRPPRSKRSTSSPPAVTPKVLLRAIESVSLTFEKTFVSHVLPMPSDTSSPSVDSDISAAESPGHTLSLEFTQVKLQLSAVYSATDPRLVKIFGNNKNPNSAVRGMAASLDWTSIELQCIAPGDSSHDRMQLLAVRQASLELLTTWRPPGWDRDQLVFADDPNLSLVIANGTVASLDGATDLQLLGELGRSWSHHHPPNPPRPKKERQRYLVAPPRLRLYLDVGHMSVVVANRAAENAATLSLTSDGLQLGCQTSYTSRAWQSESIPAQAPPSPSADTQATANTSGSSTSTLNAEPLPSSEVPATLGMSGDGFVKLEPPSLRLSLGTRNEKTYRIATFSQLDVKTTFDAHGVDISQDDGSELYHIDRSTFMADTEVTLNDGIKMELWHPEVIQALMLLASMKEPKPPKPASDPLSKLPAGVSVRLAVRTVSVFIGHPDLNPINDDDLVHGLWLQTTVVVDYARYSNLRMKPECRHLLDLKQRSKFKLFNDITNSAFEYTSKIQDKGADAALLSVLLHDTAVTSVFNGERFAARGGFDGVIAPDNDDKQVPPNVDLEYLAWGCSGPKRRRPATLESGHVPKADIAPGSILRIPYLLITGKLERPEQDKPSELRLSARVEQIRINTYMSDIYCSLLAVHAVRRVACAIRRPALGPTAHSAKRRVTLAVLVPSIWIHAFFPLKEQAFLSLANVEFDTASGKVPTLSADHAVMYVLSAAIPGMWDELALIKNLRVSLDLPRAIVATSSAMRLRIPYAYILNQLILNINVSIKTIKLLLHNMKTDHFSLIKKPISEQPKFIPTIQISVDLLHFEGRDHPIENRLNLACRVGLLEQKSRLKLDDMFEQKLNLLNKDDDDSNRPHNHLTPKQSVPAEEARWRLDWYKSRNWVKRIKRAKDEQRRREGVMHDKMRIDRSEELPISVIPLQQTVPLMRFAFAGVNVNLSPPPLTRSEIIHYMGDVSSSPFPDDVQFSLMVPFELDWSMAEAKVTLRDYPLPLLRIHPARSGPAWRVTTLFVIGEELSDDDSSLFIPIEILPEQCGHENAKPLRVQVAKSIMPVKTYARPMVKIMSPDATDLTWCTSYSSGLHDMTRVFERLSSTSFDPSSKPGFWDKLRLQLHWRVTIDFDGPCRFYLKGSLDPYAITGFGAGFALVWRRNVRINVCQPNAQRETVQVMAEELLVTIPDLSTLHDEAAVGGNRDGAEDPGDPDEIDRRYIERRSIKPCARFHNGIRFGLGFRFERTCRPWTCTKGCGDTENLFHRQCRFFDFRPHQAVVLRNPQAVERLEAEAGHPVDSFEGFRSDYIHFSVSLVAPRDPSSLPKRGSYSSFHLSPKAFAHFFAWWGLFRGGIPAPIRQGPAFPDSPPPSKKFGKNMATIKYRCDIAPVYLSHVYSMFDSALWKVGRAQSLGIKFRSGRLRMDGHQRQQEKRQWNEQLNRVKTIVHKQFYAADLLLDDIIMKGIVADFTETKDSTMSNNNHSDSKAEDECPPPCEAPLASELPVDLRKWFNFFDFIDADYKPFDRNPRMQIVHMGDCPHVFVSRRVKVLNLRGHQNADEELPGDTEASKFGHEKTHVCYLGAALGVGPMQSQIAQERVVELEDDLLADPPPTEEQRRTIQHRINILNHHIEDMAKGERRHMDDNTLQQSGALEDLQDDRNSVPFTNTLHMHCPRLFFNNNTRNVLYKYYFARNTRKREDYTTSYGALRAIRDGINKRMHRTQNGLNKDDYESSHIDSTNNMLKVLEQAACDKSATLFKLPSELFNDRHDLSRPSVGLPKECMVVPNWRFLVLKPQIALRSTADEDAIILVALNEIAITQYAVIDTQAQDDVMSNVLSRQYFAFKGMQGFYPTPETLFRSRRTDPAFKQLDFVPLEVFLDVRSETTDYERIVLRSDLAMSYDKFNQLRAARGLEWPIVMNEHGEPIEHLRKHQNLLEIVIPMMTVSATSLHYTAIYYIVTDLFNYSDPQEAKRKGKIDAFTFRFDRRDRDPQALLVTLMGMQRTIHSLAELQRGYETNVDRLTEQGKKELFRIRVDLLSELEGLFTVFDVINQRRSADAAREALKTQSRKNIRAGIIAWHMLRENGDPLLKLNIKQTLCSIEDNSDGSVEMALAIDDLQALNSNADALFTEVLSRSTRGMNKSKLHSNCFISASAITLPNVGGLRIVKEFEFYLFPVRFRLEQAVGDIFVEYLFNDKTKTRRKQSSKDKKEDMETASRSDQVSSRNNSSTTLPLGKRHGHNANIHPNENTRALGTVPDDDALEMQRRATTNFTFLHLTIGATSFVLDYKRDDKKKQHGFVIPECADFRLEAPQIEYSDQVWSAHDVLQHVMRDIKSSAWQQKGDIVSQVFKKTSIFRSKKNLRQIAGITTDMPAGNGSRAGKSPLRYTVQAATPQHSGDNEPDAKSLSSQSSIGPTSAAPSINTERKSMSSSHNSAGDDGDDERHPNSGPVRRRAHDLIGKLRRGSKHDPDSDDTPIPSPEKSVGSRHATPELMRGGKSESSTPTPARVHSASTLPPNFGPGFIAPSDAERPPDPSRPIP